MRKYKKPVAEIVRFENNDDNIRLVSGNYNKLNIKPGSTNQVNV